MRTAALVFPHQLFQSHPVLREQPEKVLLVEDTLFFSDAQYPMRLHKQKLAYHHETLAAFADVLQSEVQVEVVPWVSPESGLPKLCREMANSGIERIVLCEVHDFALEQRITKASTEAGLQLDWLTTPMFLNTGDENRAYRQGRKRWFMADFYPWQRRRFDVLMNDDKPVGGQWSFDEKNRRKLPKKDVAYLPSLPKVDVSSQRTASEAFVEKRFKSHPGSCAQSYYPTTHAGAQDWLDAFLTERFERFGPYEDAIVENESWLYHSVLTPMLNIGLLTPKQVLDRTLDAASANDTPIESVEGFVRQIIGWREFMRATYEDLGVSMRTTNHWGHHRAMPRAFYDASTGIEPIDNTIRRILDTGYCHHIERLMVLGGFMFLCEIDPDDIYVWFMEMFIDSYDWVMGDHH